MKKIGKLSIKPEKVLKNEELVNLKGGSYSSCDPDAGLMCYGPCTTSTGANGTCSHTYVPPVGKFMCACTA